jgi:hypothetical protein
LITSVIEQLLSKYRDSAAIRREIARFERRPTGVSNKSILGTFSKYSGFERG